MVFVTVGTHEQQFNRLVEHMDLWAKTNEEEVMIQTGFSTYVPKYAKWKKLFSYTEMEDNIKKARIIITHGGPSSFIAPLRINKIPIVVPRKKENGEHVNDHQLNFCREVSNRQKNIILVEEIDELDAAIENYETVVSKMNKSLASNNTLFCENFEKIVNELIR